jgi:anti-sigma factor RsiW
MADEIRSCAELDERLAPYVDGEDTAAARRAVDEHLRACPPCRAVAQEAAAARDLVRDHRGDLTAHAPESLRARCAASYQMANAGSAPLPASGSPLPASASRSSFLRRWAPLSLAATLVLAVAGVFLFGLNNRVEALAASLAMDHVRCFKVYGTGSEADSSAVERGWQHDQGWQVTVPQAEPAQQLRLVNMRKCFTSEGRSAHMMYTWRGEPISVYVLQGDVGRDRIVHRMGTQAVVWCANQRTYAVVANDGSGRDLTPIVDYMKARVR